MRTADPGRIAAGFAHSGLDLLEKRLRPRIEARPAIADPPWPDPEIIAVIFRHGQTIGARHGAHKATKHAIVSSRRPGHRSPRSAEAQYRLIASAIARKIEILHESSKGGTRSPCTVPK